MLYTKIVRKFGNSGHVVLPKDYIGKRIRFAAEPKTFEDIKSQILEILKPYLGNVLGVYLYGSYAKNEQTIDSDVDILVVANTKLKIKDVIDNYSIVSVTIKEIANALKTNSVLILPILREAKTIINPELLNVYNECKFTRQNTRLFVDATKKILELNKNGIALEFETGSLVYSLILRIRGLLMIRTIAGNKSYSKSILLRFLEDNGLSKDKIEELYHIYSSERDGIRIAKTDKIRKKDLHLLINITEGLLVKIENLFK